MRRTTGAVSLTVKLIGGAAMTCGLAGLGCHDDKPRVADSKSASAHLAQSADSQAREQQVNGEKLDVVAGLYGPMPTGIAVSKSSRVFVNFPRWGDNVKFTVGELKDGRAYAFPADDINNFAEGTDASNHFVSVQSVVVDDQDRLWILDTGSINMQPAVAGGQKLICVDLATNAVTQTIPFKPDVALPTTYLNDVRFDLERGRAYITDSSDSGPNGIIVVDLKSGENWRRLSDHPSTKAEKDFAPLVEGQRLMATEPGKPAAYLKMGSDGIALSGDKKTLYYCPLAAHHLYSVSAELLGDQAKSDAEVAASVKDLGDRGYASDGLATGKNGEIYLTDYEHNAIHTRSADGQDHVLVADPRMIWPDSMALSGDGMLYFTANQLNRQKKFHEGKDLRKQPYAIFRVPTGPTPDAQTASVDSDR